MSGGKLQALAQWHARVFDGARERGFRAGLRALARRLDQVYEAIARRAEAGLAGTRSEEWLLDNRHVIDEALEQVEESLSPGFLRRLPRVAGAGGVRAIRVHELAAVLLGAGDKPVDLEWLERSVDEYQRQAVLTIGELWALPAFLRLVLLQGLECDACRCLHIDIPAEDEAGDDEVRVAQIAGAVISLRLLSARDWRPIFERLSHVERSLRRDPEGAYAGMDVESRNRYRELVEELARSCALGEVDIADDIVARCSEPDPADSRSAHVGYYLIGRGRAALERALAFRPPLPQRARRLAQNQPGLVYFGLLAFFCVPPLAVLVSVLAQLGAPAAVRAGASLLVLVPVVGFAVTLLNGLVTWLLPPRRLMKMAFRQGIPADCRSAVTVPVLLAGEEDVDQVFSRLELNYLNNEDAELAFAVLGDLPDADEPRRPEDDALLAKAAEATRRLNTHYGKGPEEGPFLFLSRERQWNAAQNCWMGWERKRGKLMEFHRLLAGDVSTGYTACIGDRQRLQEVRYVITLDADTLLPPGEARRLLGTMAHPLSRAIHADGAALLKTGYSILQPRVEIDPDSTLATRFTRIFAGDTSLDLYSHATSDVYHDLFGQGIYAGKGVYDWQAFEHVLAPRVPDNSLLSHDLLEGVHARVGMLSDVVLLEQFPPNAVAWMRRLHRWVRGDWQLLPWLRRRVPSVSGTSQPNPLPLIHQWKIADNLRRSLQPPAVLALLLLAWAGALPGAAWAWTLLFAGLLAAPLISEVLDLAGRGLVHPKTLAWRLRAAPAVLGHRLAHWLLSLVLLPYQSYVLLDAIARTLYRLLVSRRNLLEWVTAARVQRRFSGGVPASRMWREMWISPAFAGLAAAGTAAGNAAALPVALPLLLAWLTAPQIVWWLDRPLTPRRPALSPDSAQRLRCIARRTWLFFERHTGPDDHWLPPDSFQEEPKMALARRTSPTNMGMALVSSLAAFDLGYLDHASLASWLRNSLEKMCELPRYRGHWLNWYSTRDLQPLEPSYVSTVDSGNLAACLLTLARGLEVIAAAPMDGERLFDGIVDTLCVLQESLPPGAALHAETRRLCRDLAEAGDAAARRQCLERLAQHEVRNLSEHLLHMVEDNEAALSREDLAGLRIWLDELQQQIHRAWRYLDAPADSAAGLRGELLELARLADCAVDEMDFRFLYDENRHLFHIGYNVGGGTLDPNYYDLLASEARLASYLAIARGEVPARHWLQLGRPFRRAGRKAVLMSWGATLFEYLMPSLFMRTDADSLIGRASRAAIDAHRDFVRRFDLPWGISESGYYQFDEQQQYQYRAFGVPGLGFRRDLGDRLVIAPYAAMMALPFNAPAVLDNLARLEAHQAVGRYGLFEAVDFGRTHKTGERRARVVRSYMSHHQGMTLLAIDNFLNADVMVRRFHSDPRIAGVSMLLHERLPQNPPTLKTRERPQRGKPFRVEAGPTLWSAEPGTDLAHYNLLSNGHYSLFLNADGGGGAQWDGIALTRWQPDATTDEHGQWFYVKDLDSGHISSVTHNPRGGGSCSVQFGPHLAEFQCRDQELLCRMRVAVSSQHDIEVRKLIIRNDSPRPRRLLVATCAELALAPPAEFERHPAFARLFVQSECLEDESLLLFRKRPRSGPEKPLYLAHTVVAMPGLNYRFGWETDRGRFFGRGRDHTRPRALDGGLEGFTGSQGAVLDAVMAGAVEFTVPPYGHAEVGWLTGVARSRDELLSNLRAYRSMPRVDWVFEQAWMQTGQELHNLEIDPAAVRDMTDLLSAVLVPRRELRRVVLPDTAPRSPAQSAMWARGISGDHPVLLVYVRSVQDVAVVEPLLQAHALWSGRRMAVDLVLVDEASAGYMQEASDRLRDRVAAVRARTQRHLAGSVTIVPGKDMSPAEHALIASAAQVVLDSRDGPFERQIREWPRTWLPPFVPVPSAERRELVAARLPRSQDLRFDNGWGGFSRDGREYCMHLAPDALSPAPWVNVIANPHFGCLVTESGGGCTWAGNSSEMRLTPWCNDPVSDAAGEVIYLRDEESGEVWSPTPRPMPADGPYQVVHGAGYSTFRHNSHGLTQSLCVHVDPDEPVKLIHLRLGNTCSWMRRITVTCYVEWVLGNTRAGNAAHIASRLERDANAILAWNRFSRLAGEGAAFLAASQVPHGVTADRTEFLGRGGSTRNPAALQRIGLSDRVHSDDDPCAAWQIHLNLAPGETREVHFALGHGEDRGQALALARRFSDEREAGASLQRARQRWDDLLGIVQVETPEPAFDLLLNRWLPYQTVCSRLWARSGYYQPSGAFGFRDQLQDVMALVWSAPHEVRRHILTCASRQFEDGDVLHWWHEAPLRGVRTRCSDDFLWLPFVTAYYLRATGDAAILDEPVPWLAGEPLQGDESERYAEFAAGEDSASLYEHCCRAIDRAATVGPHGLPLIGSGDWNDGFNRVGIAGRGESAWLGWFLVRVCRDFAPWCERRSDAAAAAHYLRLADRFLAQLEEVAWDGEWYRRAWFDDGTPLGSRDNDECRIDLLAQVWSVLAVDKPGTRARHAMHAAWQHLVRREERLVLLLAPPFDHGEHDPGYIKGYPPGIRENGAQYTHAAAWAVWAAARLGDGDGAMELFRLLNPVLRTANGPDAARYRVEPYVLAGDVYSTPPHTGRGGWSWYSGAAGWLYRAGLEALLGLRLHEGTLQIEPCLPADWRGYRACIRRGGARYRIRLRKTQAVPSGRVEISLDGRRLDGDRVPLIDDGRTHRVRARIGAQ